MTTLPTGLTSRLGEAAGTSEEIKVDPRAMVVVTGSNLTAGSTTVQFSIVDPDVALAIDWMPSSGGAQTANFSDATLSVGIRGIRFVTTSGTWNFRVSQVIDTTKSAEGF